MNVLQRLKDAGKGVGKPVSSSVGRFAHGGAQPRFLKQNQQPAELDPLLVWSSLGLLLLGLVMVYSSSIAIAEGNRSTGYSPYFYLIRHTVFLTIGLIAGVVAFQIPTKVWQRFAPQMFILGVMLLAAVLIPHVGRSVLGAQRWIPLGPVNLQPSELMKLFAVLYAADYTTRKLPDMSSFRKAFVPMSLVMTLVGALLLKEPDFGAFVVIICIAMGVLFLGGVNARTFVVLVLVLLVAFVIIVWTSPYRRARVFGFMDPWADEYGKGYQLSHSLIAFGRGGIFGVGLGQSVEKLFYLPEAHTDFLLAVIAEELGLVGVLVVVGMFAILIHRAYLIGRQAIVLDHIFSGLVAQGISIWLGAQGFINMGVNMGLIPTKGLTLPLMSFGGSGILANCIALALLMRIDYENRSIMRGVRT